MKDIGVTRNGRIPLNELASLPTPGSGSEETSGVTLRPPFVYLASIVLGVLLHRLWPIGGVPQNARLVIGIPLLIGSVGLFGWAIGALRRAGTGIRAYEPTTALVTTGPYCYSRNPIYLGFTLFQAGIGIALNNAWVLGLLIPTVALIVTQAIAREERYLERRIGAPYLRYKASVRRWL